MSGWPRTGALAAGLTLLASALPSAGGVALAADPECRWTGGFSGPGPDSAIHALAVYDDGGGRDLYLGGRFLTAGSVAVDHVARWDGVAWSPLGGQPGSGTDGTVAAFAVYDDGSGPALYVAGRFETAGGLTVHNIAKWDGSAWSALTGPSGTGIGANFVTDLAVYDDGRGPALYVAGDFTSAGGLPANDLARWDGHEWSALSTSSVHGEVVYGLAVYDDGSGPALFAAGDFSVVDGVQVNNVAKWDGHAWSALSGPQGTGVSGSYGIVLDLAVYDDGGGPVLYATGHFLVAGGVPVNYVAKWNGLGWSALAGPQGTGLDAHGNSLAVYDDGGGPALYVGGEFSSAGGVEVNRIAKWNGAVWSPLSGPGGAGVDDRVYALAAFDDGTGAALYAGGEFTHAGGRELGTLARWDGARWTAPAETGGNGLDSWTEALAVYDDGGGPALYAAGNFRSAGGAEVNGVAAWDGDSWRALSGPAGIGVDGRAGSLAVYDDGGGPALYAGGYFVSAGGVEVNHVARWDGTAWTALAGPGGVGLDGSVEDLAVYDDGGGSALYAAGAFLTAGGVPVNHVARWDGSAWTSLGTGTDGDVLALAVHDDGSGPALYAGGRFVSAGGVTVNFVARWDGTAWTALSGPFGTGTDGQVYTLAAYDDGFGPTLYAGGYSYDAGGVPASLIARWNGQDWSALGGAVDPPPPVGLDAVLALAVYDDGPGPALYVGGRLGIVDGTQVNHIARWDGAEWSVLRGSTSIGMDGLVGYDAAVSALRVFDDGGGAALYAGGAFVGAGGRPSRNFARWVCVAAIFADGFESGDVSAWSGAVGVP